MNFSGTGCVFIRHYDSHEAEHPFEIELHQHEWHEFVWARCPSPSGEKSQGFTINGEYSSFGDGTLLYTAPFYPHKFRVTSPLQNWVIGVDQTQLCKLFAHSPLAAPLERLFDSWKRLAPVMETEPGTTRDAIAALLDGAARQERGSLENLESIYFLVGLDRALSPWKDARKSGLQTTQGTDRIVRAAMEFLERNFAKPIGVSECAAGISVARSTLSHQFQAYTGQSLPRWLAEVRLRNARAMLIETNLTILEIALECGFNDQAWFARQFRAAVGVSPSEWRAHARGLSGA
jgi:AraC-like DNA-binding protein